MDMKKYKNTSAFAFEMVIRLGPDPESNKTFVCAPGDVMEGPAGYADVFAQHGLVDAASEPAKAKQEKADETPAKKKGG